MERFVGMNAGHTHLDQLLFIEAEGRNIRYISNGRCEGGSSAVNKSYVPATSSIWMKSPLPQYLGLDMGPSTFFN